MFKISRDAIKKLATDETVYFRGMRYYKSNAVTNATWSKNSKQYRAIVKGSNDYLVTVDASDEDNLKCECNCPAYVKYDGACKHVVAALLFVSDYMERKETKVPDTPAEKKVFQILDYFNRQAEYDTYGEAFRIEVNIAIPGLLKKEVGKAFVSIRAGSHKLYKVQNIRKFLMDYYNKENIILGKEFQFIHGESYFEKDSLEILEYLLEIYEIQEALGKVYYSNLFNKSQISFTKNMLIKLLSLLENQAFVLELHGEDITPVYYHKQNPSVCFELLVKEDGILMNKKGAQSITPITDDGQLLYMDHGIYSPDRNFIKNYLPFHNSLTKDQEPLEFSGTNKEKFLDLVLPKIHETMQIEIPDEIKDRYIEEDLRVSIYFDKYKSYIKAKVIFIYGDNELNAIAPVTDDGIILVRQKEKEQNILDFMDSIHFVPYKDFYVLKNDSDIYELFTSHLEDLAEHAQLFYSSDFKNISITNPNSVRTNLSINRENNFLEMEFDYEGIPKDELKSLFSSLQLKKKYHRLKNGSFINLDTTEFANMQQIMDKLNLSNKDFKETAFVLPKNVAPYLDQMLSDSDYINVNKSDSFLSFIEGILKPDISEFLLPNNIQADLRPYQITGYKWLKTLASNQLGGILADDMGLGKTLQAIVYIASCVEKDKKHLIVCPTSLVFNWQDEFLNFAPTIRTAVVSGAPEERQAVIEQVGEYDVIITSYPLIRRDCEFYQNIHFDTMFIDEAQFIKNANSLSAKSVKKIQADHKFALTGTPIENSLSELWSIFDFILPYYLYTHTKFVEHYEKPITKDQNKDALSDLNKHIQPFILRRMKKDVLTELPEKIETKLLTELTEQQKKVYVSYLESIRNELTDELQENNVPKNQIKILAALTRLRQICCHPSTFIDNYKGGSGKLELLMDIIPDILGNGHRILIFSQFTSMLGLIEKELKRNHISYFYLEGNTPMKDRGEYVRRFNEGEGSIFLISLKAGGTGLNLTGADTVIHYDPWWNPAVEEQATDRVYRIGQKNSVHVIKLITKGTIEEKIYKLQKKKKELSDSVIQSKEVFINKLTREELEDIFQL